MPPDSKRSQRRERFHILVAFLGNYPTLMILASRPYFQELLQNQIWQGANFISKALFLALLTPWMLRNWGPEGYGLFALASSLFVSLALLDGGIRSLTRVRLASSSSHGLGAPPGEVIANGLVAFSIICGLVGILAVGAAWHGGLSLVLRLPPGGAWVLCLSGFLTAFWMATVLALEPLAAAGQLSRVKSANTCGMMLALPACSLVLWLQGGPLPAILALMISLLVPNFWLLHQTGGLGPATKVWIPPTSRSIRETLREGFPYYLTTLALIAKTHGLTFLVSAMAGPAEAGIFYILLRLSETLSTVGATATETSVAALSSLPPSQRRGTFQQAWQWTTLFCLHGAIVLTFLGHDFWKVWVPEFANLSPWVWPALASLGLAGGWSQMVVNASMGMNQVRSASRVALGESVLALVLAPLGFYLAGFPGLFAGGSAGVLVTWIQARRLAQLDHASFGELWIRPLRSLFPGWVLCAVLLGVVSFFHLLWVEALVLLVPAILIFRHIQSFSRRGSPS